MRRNFKYIFILFLLIIAVLASRETFSLGDGNLKFYVLDIGQGDAIFVQTPSGNQILIDGGQDRKILENYKVWEFVDGGDIYNLAEYGELKKLVEEKKISYRTVQRGMQISLDKGVSLLVLTPEKLVKSDNPHNNNVVVRLSYGKVDFLLMGDGEKGEELKLVQAGDNLESEVLKVGHHGSKTSSNPLFLEKVNPEYALISAGVKNRYGHPAQSTLDNLLAAGAKILRTDVDSTIEFKTDGNNLTLTEEK